MQTLKSLSQIFGEDTPVLYILIDRDMNEVLEEMDEKLSGEQRQELLERVADADWPGMDVISGIIEHELKQMQEVKNCNTKH